MPAANSATLSRRLRPREPQPRPRAILRLDLDAEPSSRQGFGDLAGDVAAGGGVEDELAGLGEEADEELGHLRREAGGVREQAGGLALPQVVVVGAGVGDDQ